MGWINEAAVRDYLDSVVAVKVSELKVKEFLEIELIVSPDCVHVNCGISDMAKAAGCELEEEIYQDRESFPFEYSFEYKGIRFFQMNEERMAGYEDV